MRRLLWSCVLGISFSSFAAWIDPTISGTFWLIVVALWASNIAGFLETA